jgi:hypothetical protein
VIGFVTLKKEKKNEKMAMKLSKTFIAIIGLLVIVYLTATALLRA